MKMILQENEASATLRQHQDSIDCIFADPPYNIQNKPDKQVKYTTNDALRRKNWKPHFAEYDTIVNYEEFTRAWLTSAHNALAPRGSIFITGTYHTIHIIGVELRKIGFWCVAEIAWCKPNAMPNLAMYGPTQAVEWVLWYRKGEKPAHYYDKVAAKAYNNGVNIKTYWIIPKPSDTQIKYPGRKPISLIYRAIDVSTDKSKPAVIVDPFCGSGTTGDAVRYLAQKYPDWDVTCHLSDHDPMALDVTRQRLALPLKPATFYL